MRFSDSQYDEIMSSYYKNQTENRALEQSRKEEVYAAVPRIAEIDRTLALSSIDAVRSRLRGSSDTTDAAKEQNQSLIAEKLDLLKANGFSEDYLKPIYTCPLCKDTGRIGNEYCSCFKQASISLLYRQSNLEQILQTENFEHFDLSYYPNKADEKHPFTPYDNMNSILTKTKSFTENFDKEGVIYYSMERQALERPIFQTALQKHYLIPSTPFFISQPSIYSRMSAVMLL